MPAPDYIVQLQTILYAQQISQTELARRLNVTHAALNRWLHQKAEPRPQQRQRIAELYFGVRFYSRLESGLDVRAWQEKFDALKPPHGALPALRTRRDIYDDCLLKLTYNTNRIEGSTLSLRETQAVLFENRVAAHHSLTEHLEVTNHRLAFAKMLDAVENGAKPDLHFILELHRTLMSGILESAGTFRTHPVRIVGARVVTANPLSIAEKMRDLCLDLEATRDAIGIAMQHAWFEAIHPFSDGNGRIGRLLTNFQLLRAGYPLLIIRSERKSEYYDALEAAQTRDQYAKLLEFILEELRDSAQIFAD